MVAPTAGILRRPNRRGFLSPLAVLELAEIVEEILGHEAREEALREAQLFRLPAPDEPLREEKAARLHAAVRRLWPEDSDVLTRRAGEANRRSASTTRGTSSGRAVIHPGIRCVETPAPRKAIRPVLSGFSRPRRSRLP
jgi:hypothetical protein